MAPRLVLWVTSREVEMQDVERLRTASDFLEL
ncbi:hypothetical protein ABIA27_001466 [Sinorhizobium fredii]